MDYVKLGRTGLDVSRFCLGCMAFGAPDKGNHPWTLDEAASRPLLRKALEMGVNFFDTANSYSAGGSEEILGRVLGEFALRDEIVIATKVYFPVLPDKDVKPGPNAAGLSRKAIFQAIDASLKRLGVEYVDLYQIHRFDRATPIEETMEALHDVVRSGKARYIGASSMSAWEFAKAQHVAALNGWTRFSTMQNYYNLLYREEEREMLPLCADQGVGVIPWSPLARGVLARPWGETTKRCESDALMKQLFESTKDADEKVVAALAQVAQARGVPPAQIALAWLLNSSLVSAPIMGVSKADHLDDALAACAITLTAQERAALEAPYVPHAVAKVMV